MLLKHLTVLISPGWLVGMHRVSIIGCTDRTGNAEASLDNDSFHRMLENFDHYKGPLI